MDHAQIIAKAAEKDGTSRPHEEKDLANDGILQYYVSSKEDYFDSAKERVAGVRAEAAMGKDDYDRVKRALESDNHDAVPAKKPRGTPKL